MIYIQVLGQGLIPRNRGIAPKKEPFLSDIDTIRLMLNQPGLRVNFLNPYTKRFSPLTSSNLVKVFKIYDNVKIGDEPPAVVQSAPSSPVNRDVMKPADAPVQAAKYEPKPKKNERQIQEKKEE